MLVEAAVEAGVDTIELDVLWLQDAHLPLEQRAPLVVAHDWAGRRAPHAAGADRGARRLPRAAARQGRDRPRHQAARARGGDRRGAARARPDRAGDDLDDGAVHAGPDPRARTEAAARLDLSQSHQGLDLEALGEAGAAGRPDRDAPPPAGPGGGEAAASSGSSAMWVYHPLVSARLARICKLAGVELIAWTVDDEARMRKLVDAGVDGLCSNDPRLFAVSSSDASDGRSGG